MASILKPRRKPSQPRAWMTSLAIQDAFVLQLVEHGYDRISMRALAERAGVGLGTLYEYYPNKESIAAVTIRRWLRGLARELEHRAGQAQLPQLYQRVEALIAAQLDTVYAQPQAWRTLMVLERRLTAPTVYREMYLRFVLKVGRAFANAQDWPTGQDPFPVALLAFSLMCSSVRDTLMVLDTLPARGPWQAQLEQAIWHGVQTALQPLPHG